MKRWVLSIALFSCMSGLANAQSTTGELLTNCETFERTAIINGRQVSVPEVSAGMCFAYFTAVHQLAFFHLNGSQFGMLPHVCPPDGASITQFIRVFLAHARANPQNHRLYPTFEVLTALMRAFPMQLTV